MAWGDYRHLSFDQDLTGGDLRLVRHAYLLEFERFLVDQSASLWLRQTAAGSAGPINMMVSRVRFDSSVLRKRLRDLQAQDRLSELWGATEAGAGYLAPMPA